MGSLQINELVVFSRYCFVGLLTNGAGYSVYLVMVATGIHPVASSALCYCLGVALSYFLNRKWVFKSNVGHLRDIPRYLLGHAAGVVFSVACISFCLNWFRPAIAQLITIGLTGALIYSVLKIMRFGQKKH